MERGQSPFPLGTSAAALCPLGAPQAGVAAVPSLSARAGGPVAALGGGAEALGVLLED